MHPAETAAERAHLRQALIEAQKAQDAAATDEARLDVSKRIVVLAQRYRLMGGELADLPGHEGMKWK